MDKASVKSQIKEALTKLASKGLGHDGFLSGVEQPAPEKAAETVEKPPEKAADEVDAIFPSGSLVRLIEESTEHKKFLGQVAKVDKNLAGGEHVLVKFEDDTSLAPRAVPVALLEQVEKKVKVPELRTMLRVARYIKQGLLRRAGVQHPGREILTKIKAKDQVSEDTIDLFAHCVMWSFEMEDQHLIKYVPASLMIRIITDFLGLAPNMLEGISSQDEIDKRVATLRKWLELFDTLLIPVYSPRLEKSCQHWTLLQVTKSGVDVTLSYFDSLQPTHERGLSNANRILELLGFPHHKIEVKTNLAQQEGQDCGWYVIHYIEELLRRVAGHPKHSQGWPDSIRLSNLVKYCSRIVDSLEGEREKWRVENEEAEKKLEEKEKKLREASQAFLKRKDLLTRVVELYQEVAVESLVAGASLEKPSLDENFLRRYEEYQKKLREAKEARAAARAAAAAAAAAAAEAAEVEPNPVTPPSVPPLVHEPPVEPPVPAAPSVKECLKALEAKCKSLEEQELFELCVKTARLEDLGKEQQAHYNKVELSGIGVCSRCRWKTGCLSCDKIKAWRYVVKWELGMRALDVEQPFWGDAAAPKASGGGFMIEVFSIR